MFNRILCAAIVASFLGVCQVSAEAENELGGLFYRPLEDGEYKDWALELAGNDPARRAAMLHWLSVGTGFNVVIDRNWERLAEIRVEDFELKPEHLKDMHLFPEIDLFTMERAKFSDEALDVLPRQNHLTWIYSEDARYLDNRICQALAQLPNLQRLSLSGAQIDDEGASQLAKISTLITLGLNGTKLTSAGLKELTKLRNLTYLSAAHTLIDDEGLRHVATLSKLIWLELDNTQITDAGIEHLRPLKSLKVLLLAHTGVTDRAVEVFVSFDAPNRIDLEGTKVTNEAARLLAPLPKLGEVNLRNTAVDDGCVPHFEKMKVLHTVDLRGTKISKAGIERIRAALKPSAALYNDHGVPVTDRARVKAERED